MNSDDDSLSTSDDGTASEATWITWFCRIRGNEFFCEVCGSEGRGGGGCGVAEGAARARRRACGICVDARGAHRVSLLPAAAAAAAARAPARSEEEYITDDFNLTGLAALVPYYDYALDLILNAEHPNMALLSEEQQEMVDAAAELLYGLIHARYIVTTKGLQAMVRRRGAARQRGRCGGATRAAVRRRRRRALPLTLPSRRRPRPSRPATSRQHDKLENREFGRCGRVRCEGSPLLPVGESDLPRRSQVCMFCARCGEVYAPQASRHLSAWRGGARRGGRAARARGRKFNAPSLPPAPRH